jgi:hypothetical protein
MPDAAQQVGESGVGAEGCEHRIDFQGDQKVAPFLEGYRQPTES